MSKKLDIQFGLDNETKVLPIISKFLNTNLNKLHHFSPIDWVNETKTIYVELKSRRIRHNQYETALLGLNKIKNCNNKKIEYYFVWQYIDGLFYLKYDEELFKSFNIEEGFKIGFRQDVGHSELSTVVHIPYKLLKKVDF